MCGMFLAALSGVMIVALLNDIIPMQPLYYDDYGVITRHTLVLPIVMAKAFDTFQAKPERFPH